MRCFFDKTRLAEQNLTSVLVIKLMIIEICCESKNVLESRIKPKVRFGRLRLQFAFGGSDNLQQVGRYIVEA